MLKCRTALYYSLNCFRLPYKHLLHVHSLLQISTHVIKCLQGSNAQLLITKLDDLSTDLSLSLLIATNLNVSFH